MNERIYSQKREFDGKKYFTDFKKYNSKIEAKYIVTYLKTKDLSVKARIIDKKDFAIIYYHENTYYKIIYGNLKIPNINEIPADIKEIIEKKYFKTENQIKKQKFEDKLQFKDQQHIDFQLNKRDKFQIIKLEQDLPTVDLLFQESKPINENLENSEDDIEEGINITMEHIKNEFFKLCPKCGGKMRPNYLILGNNLRISVFQCIDCKFYIPRRI